MDSNLYLLLFYADGTILEQFEPVGCFKDKRRQRAFPTFKSFQRLLSWYNMTVMNASFRAIIRACAEMANTAYGVQYFGIQGYHECWTGVNGSLTYNRHGKSNKCVENYGVGAAWANFVYRFVEG